MWVLFWPLPVQYRNENRLTRSSLDFMEQLWLKKKKIFLVLQMGGGQFNEKHLNMKQDVGLYTCGARNELSGRGERAEGVVYLSIEQGGRFVNNLSLDVIMIDAKKVCFEKAGTKNH